MRPLPFDLVWLLFLFFTLSVGRNCLAIVFSSTPLIVWRGKGALRKDMGRGPRNTKETCAVKHQTYSRVIHDSQFFEFRGIHLATQKMTPRLWITNLLENSSRFYMGVLVATCTFTIAIVVSVVRILAQWLRMHWHLRKIPHPKERWPFSLALDMWKALSEMDPELEVTASKYTSYLLF